MSCSFQRAFLWFGITLLACAAVAAEGAQDHDLVIDRYDTGSVPADSVVHIYVGELFTSDYLRQEQARMEALVENPSGVLDTSKGGVPRKESFECKLWINGSSLHDGVVHMDLSRGVAAHFSVLTKERYFFLDLLFPEDGARFRGIIDTAKGRYIRFDKEGRILLKQSKRELKPR